MRAMILCAPDEPLLPRDLPRPVAAADRVLVQVEACAVCRTDLHIVDGELAEASYPIILGHQVVGRVVADHHAVCAGGTLSDATGHAIALGERVGVPWLGGTCGRCGFCSSGRENLCDDASFTGYTLPGGFAEYMPADPRFCFPLSETASAEQIAPLLCAGMIGYRALKMCGDAERIGIFGFGAAAHVLAQVIRFQGRELYAFTRPGDAAAQAAAERLGARWAKGSDERPREPLDAAIIFAPVGALVPAALRAVVKGGIVVCAGIHMSDVPQFPYALLWGERRIVSVANLTRADGTELLELAKRIPIKTAVHVYPLERANSALADLREGAFDGSAVLRVGAP